MLSPSDYELEKQKLLRSQKLIEAHEAELERIRIANKTKILGFGIGDTVNVDWNETKWEIGEFYPSKYHKGEMRAKLIHRFPHYKSKEVWSSDRRRYVKEESGVMFCSSQVELLRQPAI